MYASRPWTVRQYAGFSTAEESNKFYRANLAAGQMGLSVAFDLATHRGYNSDHPRVVGDVGKAGVAINSVEDMKILFDGIPLDKMSVSMTMNGAVLPVLAGYIVAAEEQGVPQDKLSGTIQNDILKEFMVRNTYIYPPGPSMRIVADIIEHTAQHMPKFNSISISGYHMQEAGADLGAGARLHPGRWAGVRARRQGRGPGHDAFAPRLSFFFCIGMNFFMEAAKLRAARFLWPSSSGRSSPRRPIRCRCARTANLGRVADREALQQHRPHRLRGDGGGRWAARSRCTPTRSTRRLRFPTVASARITRDTQFVLQRDQRHQGRRSAGRQLPVEALTSSLIAEARKLIAEVEALGGMTKAVKSPHARAAHRRSSSPQAGARRSRRGGRGRASTSSSSRKSPPSRSSMSTTTWCASPRWRGCRRSAPTATRPSASRR